MTQPSNLQIYEIPSSPIPPKAKLNRLSLQPNLIGDLLPYGTYKGPKQRKTRPKSATLPTRDVSPVTVNATTDALKATPPKSSFIEGADLFDRLGSDLQSSLSPTAENAACKKCGQAHSIRSNHIFDYHASVDEDLTCQICLQPLVDPVDTKCAHTFCSICLNNYLKIQSICPVDRTPLIVAQVQQSAVIVRR